MNPRSWVNSRLASAALVGTTTIPPATSPLVFVIAIPDSPIQPTAASKPPTSLSASSTCWTPSLSDASEASRALSRFSAPPKSWASTRATVSAGTSDGRVDAALGAVAELLVVGLARLDDERAVLGLDRDDRPVRVQPVEDATARRSASRRPPGPSADAAVDDGLGVDVGEGEPVAGDRRRGGLELLVGVEAGLAAGVDGRLDGARRRRARARGRSRRRRAGPPWP